MPNMSMELRPIADIAREMKTKVNLGKLCEGRDLSVTNFKLKDGSTIKLLENSNEVDCIVMKNGKVLTAKGKIFSDETAASELATDVTFKIANRGDVVDSHFGTYA